MTDSGRYATLPEDTAVVKLYPPEKTAQEWMDEADYNGSSRSRYLQNLILEARAYRSEGLLKDEGDQQRIQELEEKVEQLERRLEEKQSESAGAISFDPATLKQDVLTDNYQSLEDILRKIVESGVLDELLRQPVENQLYFLAAQDEVQYERGWGWKLAEQGGEQ
ncbi:hypothetical protein [Halococcus sediminicola]|uniref:hypothetical protein n=1 Tax=Halococcus sediminicola TaxID=1264579 RepID=UPI00067855D7|nr:hypothetical protein [Halococcus sediminicola]